MSEAKGILCVGGPLDGRMWPAGRGSPVVPVNNQKHAVWVEEDEPRADPTFNDIRYRQRQMTGPNGLSHLFFAPDDWSTQKLSDALDRIAPCGFGSGYER